MDPLSVNRMNEKNASPQFQKESTQVSATWEHEELAQVRIKVLRGHTDTINTCRYCDNDTKIITSSNDKSVRLWDVSSGETKQTYNGHSLNVTSAAANNDTTRFVSSGWDKKLHVWNTETGRILWTGSHGGIVTCCNFSHDGKFIVSGSDLDYSLRIWDAHDGTLIHDIKDLHSSTVTSCAFNSRNDRIVTTSMDKTTKFWDIKSKTNTIQLSGHDNVISDCSISYDERNVATASWDKSIQVWDISTGMYRSLGPTSIPKAHEGSVSSVSFSKDGSLLVSGGYDTCVSVWDVQNGCIQKLKLQGHGDWVEDVCFSDDHRWILSCSKDKTVRLWNIEDSDKIPVVLETKKSVGIQIVKCANCGKPFSLAQMEGADEVDLCVFCRLQAPEKPLQLE